MNARKNGGSKFLYQPFDANAARLETHEKVTDERWAALERRLSMIEASLDRLDKRLWLAVFGVVSIVLARGVTAILQITSI
jgi:hypothetical protein